MVFHDGFRTHKCYLGFLQPPEFENVIFDIHRYQCFVREDLDLDIYGHIRKSVSELKDEADTLGGTELIVNGAGATVTSLRDRGNQVFWQDATIPGFLYVTIVDDRLTGEFFDKAGVSQYTRSFTHP